MNGLVRKVPDVIIRHICVLTPQAQSSEFNIIRKLKMSPEGTIVPGELNQQRLESGTYELVSLWSVDQLVDQRVGQRSSSVFFIGPLGSWANRV